MDDFGSGVIFCRLCRLLCRIRNIVMRLISCVRMLIGRMRNLSVVDEVFMNLVILVKM